MKKYKTSTNLKRKTIPFELQSSTDLKHFTASAQSAKKKHKCSWTKFSSTRKKCHFSFPSKLKEKYLSGITFKGLITYDGRCCTFQGDVTRGDSQQRLLAQHSVVTLLRHCFEWLQHCSNIAALCCPKNRPV